MTPGPEELRTEPAAETQNCRRCGGRFTVSAAAGRGMMVCPHCGTSVAPLLAAWKSNQNAVVLACAALLLLVPAVLLPFMSIVKLGRTDTYSLVGGIRQLAADGQWFLAAIIFLFSLVFPIAKLLLILVATSSLLKIPDKTRYLLHDMATHTAKYSMLDVFVIAVLVVVIKLGKSTEVHIQSGTVLFCAAIFLSMLASACVALPRPEKSP
jgi:paraquat-inducible protein A